jgi:hypothetical protein
VATITPIPRGEKALMSEARPGPGALGGRRRRPVVVGVCADPLASMPDAQRVARAASLSVLYPGLGDQGRS